MGRGKRTVRTRPSPLAAPASTAQSGRSLFLTHLAEERRLLAPLALSAARLGRRRKLACEGDLRRLDAGRKVDPSTPFAALLASALLLTGFSDLFEPGDAVEESELAELEQSLRAAHPEALDYLAAFPATRADAPWLATKTEAALLENFKRYAALVEWPQEWALAEALEQMDFEQYEPFDFEDLLRIFGSLDSQYAGFQERLEPLLQVSRRLAEQLGPLRSEPVVVVDGHPLVKKALEALDNGLNALATASRRLVVFSEEAAKEALEQQERRQLDVTTLHEFVHLTQPWVKYQDDANQGEDTAEGSDEDSDEDSEEKLGAAAEKAVVAERVSQGRTAIFEGVTEALARRLIESELGEWRTSLPPSRDSYDFESRLADALAERRHPQDREAQDGMLKRLSLADRRTLLEGLRRELDREALEESFLEAVGWLFRGRYSEGHQIDYFHSGWFKDSTLKDVLDSLEAGEYDVKEPVPARAAQPARDRRSALAG